MKGAEQYLINDGIIASPNYTSSTENDEILNSNVSEFVTISSQSNALSTNAQTKSVVKKIKKNRNKIPGALRLRKLVVKQCTKDLISPTELSSKHGISIKTIQNWVSSSGATLPRKYRKRLIKVSIPTNDQPYCSSSSSYTTYGDHSYTKIDFNSSTAVQNPYQTKSLHCPIPMCKFATSRKNALDLHIRSHTSCKQCGEVFPGKRQLLVHLTTHKKEKNKLCEFCGKEFKDRSNRWRHMKNCKKRPEDVKTC